MPLVEICAVSKRFAGQGGRFAVRDVSLTVEAGETLGVVGESGSGKTTLARMLLGLIAPSSGTIRVAGIDLATASASQMKQVRRQMQPVFQDPFGALNPRMKILEIVAEPLIIHGDERHGDGRHSNDMFELNRSASSLPILSSIARREKVIELLAQVGLDASALDRFPHEFSGGQRQRINIARALALRPRLLVLDEPVSALDVSVGAQIVNLLRDLQLQFGLTYFFISHSMPLVRYLSTRIAVMQQGRVVEQGRAEELCATPETLYTRALIAATPELPSAASPSANTAPE